MIGRLCRPTGHESPHPPTTSGDGRFDRRTPHSGSFISHTELRDSALQKTTAPPRCAKGGHLWGTTESKNFISTGALTCLVLGSKRTSMSLSPSKKLRS